MMRTLYFHSESNRNLLIYMSKSHWEANWHQIGNKIPGRRGPPAHSPAITANSNLSPSPMSAEAHMSRCLICHANLGQVRGLTKGAVIVWIRVSLQIVSQPSEMVSLAPVWLTTSE